MNIQAANEDSLLQGRGYYKQRPRSWLPCGSWLGQGICLYSRLQAVTWALLCHIKQMLTADYELP